MEKIKINGTGPEFPIRDIRPISPHILQIVFDGNIPEEWGDITIYTSGGIEASTLKRYGTVYRQEGQTVFLSNDGSVYEPPQEPEDTFIPSEPYVPTEEELLAYAKASKHAEVNAACESCIVRGVDVQLSDGTVEHFDLKDRDQMNLFAKQVQLEQGMEMVEYHSDSDPVSNCKYYSSADMQTIIETALFHVSYHQTYCISLKVWLNACQSVEEVQEIFYGADIPEAYRSEVLNTYLVKIASMAEALADG